MDSAELVSVKCALIMQTEEHALREIIYSLKDKELTPSQGESIMNIFIHRLDFVLRDDHVY